MIDGISTGPKEIKLGMVTSPVMLMRLGRLGMSPTMVIMLGMTGPTMVIMLGMTGPTIEIRLGMLMKIDGKIDGKLPETPSKHGKIIGGRVNVVDGGSIGPKFKGGNAGISGMGTIGGSAIVGSVIFSVVFVVGVCTIRQLSF